MFGQPKVPLAHANAREVAAIRPAVSASIIVFLLGIAITAALSAFAIKDAYREEFRHAYEEEATPLIVHLGRSIDDSLKAITSISGFLAASSVVDRDDFRAFAWHILLGNPEIQALEWIPRIAAEERTAYEAAARRDGLTDFQITERNPAGEAVRAAARSEYFPVYFVEPLDGNEAALGFDLASNPARLEALNRARDTGKTAATSRIRLVQETGEQFGFLAFAPIYSTGSVPETVAARREALTGFALGVFRIGDIVQSAMVHTQPLFKFDFYVLDADASPGAALLHHSAPPEQEGGNLTEDQLLLGGYEKTVLAVADHSWALFFAPRAGFRFPDSRVPWIVGIFGILLTFVAVVSLRTAQNRTRIIEKAIIERTAELSTVNQAFVAEMDGHQKTEKFLRLISDTLPLIVSYFDTDKIIRFINQVAVEWHARPREEIIGARLSSNITELNAADQDLRMDMVLEGEPQTFNRALTFPDGIFREVTITYIPHFDEAGGVIGFFGIVQDISQRLKIERQFNQAQKMEAIGQLTGGIAHDFNNILMVTDGYTRRALKNIDDPETVKASLEEVLTGSDRAAQLTKQLLSFSRRQVMEKKVFRVEEAISEIESLLQKSSGENYEVHIESFTDGACVETDASEFQQALINLVINARDAMERGGRIEIASRIAEMGEEFVAKHPKLVAGQFVEVSVKDYGTGIDQDTLGHIFEPFFTTKDQGKGTGLGLAMVYGFAQTSNGALEVESAVGAGTTFKIYLPAVDRDPQVIIAEVGQDYLGQGETILLVEDDPALLELVREMLDALGYNVLTATDGFEAIEVEANYDSKIDLLLSDVVMPTIGGFEMAEMIRESRPDIKIVFMSGYPNRAGISNENLPDNCQFLQKPVKSSYLAQTVRQELDKPTLTFNDDSDEDRRHDNV